MSEVTTSSLALPVEADDTGLDLPKGMPVAQWRRTGESLGQIDRACRWWIGDWLSYGELEYGERYAPAAAATGYSEQTLMDAVWVARSVSKSRRVKRLSFSHHKAVAKLKPAEQERYLADAARNDWSVSELRKRIGEEAGTAASPSSRTKKAVTRTTASTAAAESKNQGARAKEPQSPAERVGACASCAATQAAILRALLGELRQAVNSDPDAAEGWHEAFGELADIAAEVAEETRNAIDTVDQERKEAARLGIELRSAGMSRHPGRFNPGEPPSSHSLGTGRTRSCGC